tara:strand:+ start:544 stop:846 length:303 start_codon:yes stop_codon:yes gene_type:complete
VTNKGEHYAFQENAHCAGGKRIERAIGANEERGSYISSQMRGGLGIFVLTAPAWATDVLILRARLLALAAYAGSLPHLKGVLVDGNVFCSIEYLESLTVE